MKTITTILFIAATLSLNAQNLVPNPSFEGYSACPNGYGQVAKLDNWSQPTAGTSDFLNKCANPPSNVDVPGNNFGSQATNTGNGYAGCYTYALGVSNYREYVEVQLTAPLTAGQTYDVSFYVSLSDQSDEAISNIGAYFSNAYVSSFSIDPLPVAPQITNSTGIISDKVNWTLISGSFVAAGGEQYITIGCFVWDVGLSRSFVGGGSGANEAYYYVDDVSVALSGLPVTLSFFSATSNDNNTVSVEWETESELNNDYFCLERSTNGKSYSEIARITGTGNSNSLTKYQFTDQNPKAGINYYRLKQVDVDGTTFYSTERSVVLQIKDDFAINELSFTQQGKVTLDVYSKIETTMRLNIYDLTGRVLINRTLELNQGANHLNIDFNISLTGICFFELGVQEERYQRKVHMR